MAIDNTETNNGSGPTVIANTIRFYLSLDNVITGLTGSGDILIGSRIVPLGLAAGANSSATTIVTVPRTVALGTYFIGAIADATNAQPEIDKMNNWHATATTITVGRDVDLVMSAVSTTATSVAVGISFAIANTETNNGTTSSTVANTVRFYLSSDTTITTADTLLTGTRSIAAGLLAGASNSATTTVTVPRSLTPGTYHIGAIADATGAQLETNENNNTLAGNAITVVRDVDLVMSAVSTTATSVAGAGSFAISSTVLNQGTGPTVAPNTVRFYLSLDNVITGLTGSGDILLTGTRSVSAGQAAKAGGSAITTVTVPLTVTPGTYFIGAIADATSAQPESDETNNALAGNTIIVLRDVDLVMSAVNTTATSVVRGGSFSIANTETNNGTTRSTVANTIRFYLSSDNVITGLTGSGDILIGTRSVAAGLLAGTSNSATTTVTVPLTTPLGTYFIGAIADATGVQIENNENNNALVGATITVN